MNIQTGNKYIVKGGNMTPYYIYTITELYLYNGWVMLEFNQQPLYGGRVSAFTTGLGNFTDLVLEQLTPETLIKYTTLQDMCWSGLTHNMALDLWNKGYRKV